MFGFSNMIKARTRLTETFSKIEPTLVIQTELNHGKIFYLVSRFHPMCGFMPLEHFETKDDAQDFIKQRKQNKE
jgi:hypothetical protein